MPDKPCINQLPHAGHMWSQQGRMQTCPGVGEVAELTRESHAQHRADPLTLLCEAAEAVRGQIMDMQRQLATCGCDPDEDGLDPECPMHGAIASYNGLAELVNRTPAKLREIFHDNVGEPQVLIFEQFEQWLRVEVGKI